MPGATTARVVCLNTGLLQRCSSSNRRRRRWRGLYKLAALFILAARLHNAEAQTCTPTITDPSNGKVFTSNSGVAPSTALFVCDLGYTLSGSQTLDCTSGTWSGSAPTCIPNTCYTITPAPTYGSFSYSNGGVYPSTATLTCDSGYYATSGVTPECQETGYYSGLVPTCSKTLCPEPSNPTGGSVTIYRDSTGAISQADFTCDTGYTLDPDPSPATTTSHYCTQGAWDADPPTCAPITCSAPTTVAHATYTVSPSSYAYPARAFYTCASGYVRNTSTPMVVHSSDSGFFAGTQPACVAVQCYALPNPPGGSWTVAEPATFSLSGTYTCKSGYTLSSGSTTRQCQAAGNWDGTAAVCTPT